MASELVVHGANPESAFGIAAAVIQARIARSGLYLGNEFQRARAQAESVQGRVQRDQHLPWYWCQRQGAHIARVEREPIMPTGVPVQPVQMPIVNIEPQQALGLLAP